MLELILAIFLGILAGIITGLTPGVHINLVSIDDCLALPAYPLQSAEPPGSDNPVEADAGNGCRIHLHGRHAFRGQPDQGQATGHAPLAAAQELGDSRRRP